MEVLPIGGGASPQTYNLLNTASLCYDKNIRWLLIFYKIKIKATLENCIVLINLYVFYLNAASTQIQNCLLPT